MRLVVRSQRVLGTADTVVRLRVFCPGQRRSVDVDECAACPRGSGLTHGREEGKMFDCAVPVSVCSDGSPQDPGAGSGVRRDVAIGELVGPSVLCVDGELPAGRLSHAFEEWAGVELPVVDGEGRLLGSVWREDYARARRPEGLRATLGGEARVADRAGPATAINEGSTIDHAVEVLTGRRARTLILVRTDETVAGVLSDLELLRWLTRERRRRLAQVYG